jgi:parvulin-like peptidyl-prolyl isomerase
MCYIQTQKDRYIIYVRKRFIEDDYYFDDDDEKEIICYDSKTEYKLMQDEIAELFAKYDGVIDIGKD